MYYMYCVHSESESSTGVCVDGLTSILCGNLFIHVHVPWGVYLESPGKPNMEIFLLWILL